MLDNKEILLTFDDGPNPDYTPEVLSILEKYNVKVNFFVVGKEVEKHPDLLRKIHDHGHAISNHTFSHQAIGKLYTIVYGYYQKNAEGNKFKNYFYEEIMKYSNTKSQSSCRHTMISISCHSFNKSATSVSRKVFERELFQSYVSILKAIARHIRRKDKHINKNIKKLAMQKLMFFYSNEILSYTGKYTEKPKVYLPAYVYSMWRRDIEGHKNFSDVHRKIRVRGGIHDLPLVYSVIMKGNLYQYFLNEYLLHYKNKNSTHYKVLICVLEYIMAVMFMQHYNNWIELINKIETTEELTMMETINYNMPFFMVKYPSLGESNKIEIHYWIPKT